MALETTTNFSWAINFKLNISMSTESKSLSETLKDALAKKHAAAHPDAKQRSNKAGKPGGGNAPKGPPIRKAASRGG